MNLYTEKEFVSYNEALELRELGFNEPCLAYWNMHPYSQSPFNLSKPIDNQWCLPTPTWSQAFRWFKIKGLDYKIENESEGIYIGFCWNGVVWMQVGEGNYKEAELACLRKLIGIVKQGGNK